MPITRAYNKAASLFPPISNLVINGGFDIWQRGTSFTALGKTFTADRWWKWRSGDASGGTWSRQNSAVSAPGTQYCMRIQRDSGNTSTASMKLFYDFETSNSIIYAGQQVTVSFYARKGANYSGGDFNLVLVTGTGTDQSLFAGYTGGATALTVTATAASMNTSTFVRYSGTVTLASTVTQFGFEAVWIPTGTAGAADFVEITGIQLELGPVATQFTRAGGTLAGELAACQRYFQILGGDNVYEYFGIGSSMSVTESNCVVPLKVTMRSAPTTTFTTASNYKIVEGVGAGVACTSVAGDILTKNTLAIQFQSTNNLNTYRANRMMSNNTTSATIQISAEL